MCDSVPDLERLKMYDGVDTSASFFNLTPPANVRTLFRVLNALFFFFEPTLDTSSLLY